MHNELERRHPGVEIDAVRAAQAKSDTALPEVDQSRQSDEDAGFFVGDVQALGSDGDDQVGG